MTRRDEYDGPSNWLGGQHERAQPVRDTRDELRRGVELFHEGVAFKAEAAERVARRFDQAVANLADVLVGLDADAFAGLGRFQADFEACQLSDVDGGRLFACLAELRLIAQGRVS